VAGDYVNLNEVGVLTKSGQGYEGTAEDKSAESRSFVGRMDASKQGLKGAAGTTFTGVADAHGGNLVQLANQIAQQAVRAVRGERTVVTADQDADTSQSGTVAAVETQAQAVSRPINF
jgi:hypothetical protein